VTGPTKGDAIANPIDSRNATDEREWISATVGGSGFRADVQAGPHAFIADHGLELAGKHYEIYLSDPSRTAPEKTKTILRQPGR